MSGTQMRLLNKYAYNFPLSLIAQAPASPRDSARLLVYDLKRDRACFDVFKNIAKYLPQNSVLVMNDTKVIPARIPAKRKMIVLKGGAVSGGGGVKLLYLGNKKGLIQSLSNKKLKIGEELCVSGSMKLRVVSASGAQYDLKPSFSSKKIASMLSKFGETPIPPYIKNSPLTESQLRQRYQSIFARVPGSVAAPTASLHFSKTLLRSLARAGHDTAFVTLHVNLGTFALIAPEQLHNGRLHEEYYSINQKTADLLNEAKKSGRRIIAVGTTAVRTLESACSARGRLKKLSGTTDLFIREGYKFKFIDGMITNFHVPRSSLLMLVAAFTGRKKILGLYKKAIDRDFRLFSFGDGMLIL